MKKLFFFAVLIALCSAQAVSQYSWQWVTPFNGQGMERIWDLHIDKNDNILVCGQFTDSLAVEEYYLRSEGLSDTFIAKLSSEGSPLWVYQLGGGGDEVGLAVESDDEGNVIFSGYFDDTISILGQQHVAKGWDAFVIKLNSSGVPQWFYSPVSAGSEIAHSVAVNGDGTSCFTGWFQGKITLSESLALNGYGSSDIFLVSLSPDGEVNWGKNMGSEEVDYGYSVELDSDGNPCFCGVAGQGSLFDDEVLTKSGFYVSKYDYLGNIDFLTAGAQCGIYGLAADHSGGIAVAGYTSSTIMLGNIEVPNETNTEDILLARTNGEGEWQDATSISGSGRDKIRKVVFDNENNAYYIGSFTDTLTVGGIEHIAREDDVVLIKLNPEWQVAEAVTLGGPNSEKSYGIGLDSEGAVLVSFWFEGTMEVGAFTISSGDDSNPGSGVAKLINTVGIAGNHEIVSARLYPNPVKDYLIIEAKKPDVQYHCSIYDFNGNMVLQQTIKGNKTLDLRKLENGIHLIKLNSSGVTSSFKIIKK